MLVKAVRDNETAAKEKDLDLVNINDGKLRPNLDGLYGNIDHGNMSYFSQMIKLDCLICSLKAFRLN